MHQHNTIWWDKKARRFKALGCHDLSDEGCSGGEDGGGYWEGDELVWQLRVEKDGKTVPAKIVWAEKDSRSFAATMYVADESGTLKRDWTFLHIRESSAMLVQLTPTDLITLAAIVFGFGVVVIMFRIERELEMRDKGERNWIAYSDYLVFTSIGVSTLIVLLPVLTVPAYRFIIPAARAGCVAAIILEAGYIPSILAHYRLGIGKHRTGPRGNPEPAERLFVWATVVISAICFCGALFLGLSEPIRNTPILG